MNWLKKTSLQKIAQELRFPLSVNGLRDLLYTIKDTDSVKQQYLIEGPEVYNLQILRRINPLEIKSIIKYFSEIFTTMEENISYEVEEIPKEQIEEEENNYLEIIVSDSDQLFYNEEEEYDFYNSLEESEQFNALHKWFDTLLSPVRNSKQIYKMLYNMSKSIQSLQSEKYPINVSGNDIKTIQKLYNKYLREYQDHNIEEELLTKISYTTQQILQNIEMDEYDKDYFPIPKWFNMTKFLQSSIKDEDLTNEFIKWYKTTHRNEVQQYAEEYIYEIYKDTIEEEAREIEHTLGVNIRNFIGNEIYYNIEQSNYDTNNENDPRNETELDTILSFIKKIQNIPLKKDEETIPLINMYIYGINQSIESNENIKFIFLDTLNNMEDFDQDSITQGIEQAIVNNYNIPSSLQTENVEKLREEIIRTNKIREKATIDSSSHKVSPEELKKLKDLGISKKPFQHEYEMRQQKYPGSGWMKMKKLRPFTIAISPSDDKIPKDLLKDMTLHTTIKNPDAPPLGWVGGYIDMAYNIMYIAEVQSDVMQRTSYMRDPKKIEKEIQEENIKIQDNINKIQERRQNTISPKRKAQQTIQRLQLENQKLDQNNPIYIKNQNHINALTSQLSNMPDIIDTSKMDKQIENLQKQLQENQNKIKNDPRKFTGDFIKEFPQWHSYKSKVENYFKDWISIFFNTAIREAIQRDMKKIRIITSNQLMKIWSNFASPKTKILFKRIYDDNAKKMGATLIEDNNKEWYEIDTDSNKLKWAHKNIHINKNGISIMSNWLKKAMSDFEAQLPSGKFVWQIHLDTFFKIMKKKMPELRDPEFEETDYNKQERMMFIFKEWLENIPEDIKDEIGNIKPGLKRDIRNYIISKYGFDPYVNLEEETQTRHIQEPDIKPGQHIPDAPTPEELKEWWS